MPSAALIVLCSPVAATRPAVNEEVRLFRSRHPERPVIPVILDGAYPGNFPPALRFEVTPEGAVTDRPLTILGPDLRETGDGKSLGLAKVVAGLTGLAPDDIYRRAERARRQQNRVRAVFAALALVLVAGGSFFAWQNWQRQQTLAEIEALVARYSTVGTAEAAAPGARQGLKEAITAIAQGREAIRATAKRWSCSRPASRRKPSRCCRRSPRTRRSLRSAMPRRPPPPIAASQPSKACPTQRVHVTPMRRRPNSTQSMSRGSSITVGCNWRPET